VSYSAAAVKKLFGSDSLQVQQPIMIGEDFGHFLERRPGSFILVGQANSDENSAHSQGLHSPTYDFNDAIIPLVVEYFAELAEDRLAVTSS
jgi:metal-dependent amidase/aminoacylase/carboxypeptidase family protein